MDRKLSLFLVFALISSLLAAGCMQDLGVTVQGQLDETQDSGTIGLDIELGNNQSDEGNNSGQGSNEGSAEQQQNEPIVPTSTGFLILIGLGLLIMAGLVIGLMSQNRANQ